MISDETLKEADGLRAKGYFRLADAYFELRALRQSHRELMEALELAGNLFAANHAISQFDWSKSALRAEDIRELNEVPLEIRKALANARKLQP